MNGLGNDFVIVDARAEPFRPNKEEIVRICDREQGIGADELIVLEPSAYANLFMRIFNVDGVEVEACGNATRCVAWMMFDESGAESISIETLAGILECSKAGDHKVRVEMGEVATGWQDIPLAGPQDTASLPVVSGGLKNPHAVNVGNPHAVFFVDNLDELVDGDAEAAQEHPLFPEQANIGVAEITGDHSMRLRVYERGAGWTKACGSGACAAAYAACARGLTDKGDIAVALPGGELTIAVDRRHVSMTGPLEFEYAGTLPA